MTENSTRNATEKSDEVTMLADEAHAKIRADILSGTLGHGSPLRDSVLASAMGISRSPVREALRTLEQSGLVTKSPNRSYRVVSLSTRDIAELAALRAADEILAVRTIIVSGVPLAPLAARLKDLKVASKKDSPLDVISADTAFHLQLIELAGLPRLKARYQTLIDLIRLAIFNDDASRGYRSMRIVERHEDLLHSLQQAQIDGNVRRVVTDWERHILKGMTSPNLVEPLWTEDGH